MYRARINHVERMDSQGTMYVVNHMKLQDHQVAVIFDFFDEYLNLLDCGEEQAEDFYKKIMRM
ncbi:hypothetical protein NPM07_29045 [Bacillus cereus]|nr:hypothetical protein [Bacillus cereus]